MIKRSVTSFLLGTSLVLPMAAQSDNFSIVVMTDSQFYAERHPEILEAQIDWIVANQDDGGRPLDPHPIIYVAQTGDLKDDQFCDDRPINVGTGAGRTEWQIAHQAYQDLDMNNIPYAVLPGNHDFDPESGSCPNWTTERPLSQYNALFGPARFAGDPFYGDPLMNRPGNRTTGSNEDNFTLFESNGIKFISINLAYRPAPNGTQSSTATDLLRDNPELAWADNLLKTYPDRLGIVTSHYFLNTNDGESAPIGPYGQAVYDALSPEPSNPNLSPNPNLFMMLSGHWWGEAWVTETTNRAGLQPVQLLMANYQGHEFPDDGDPNTPADTPNPALIDFSNLPAKRRGEGSLDSGFMRIMRFDTDTGMVDIETFIPPVVVVPIKNRTGTLASTYFPVSAAGVGEFTASNLSFSFEGYVTLPSPPDFQRTGSLANDQFLRFLGGSAISAAEINSRCADRNGCQMTLTRQVGTATPTVFGPINFFYDPDTATWSGGAVTPTGVNGAGGTAVILGASGRPSCYFSDWDSSTATGIPDRNLNWSVIIGNNTSTPLNCTLTIAD